MQPKTKKIIVLAVTLPTVVFLGWLAWDQLIQPVIAKRKNKASKSDDKDAVAKPPVIAPASTEIPKVAKPTAGTGKGTVAQVVAERG